MPVTHFAGNLVNIDGIHMSSKLFQGSRFHPAICLSDSHNNKAHIINITCIFSSVFVEVTLGNQRTKLNSPPVLEMFSRIK